MEKHVAYVKKGPQNIDLEQYSSVSPLGLYVIQDDAKHQVEAQNKVHSIAIIQEKSLQNGELNVFKTCNGLYPYNIYDIGDA